MANTSSKSEVCNPWKTESFILLELQYTAIDILAFKVVTFFGH